MTEIVVGLDCDCRFTGWAGVCRVSSQTSCSDQVQGDQAARSLTQSVLSISKDGDGKPVPGLGHLHCRNILLAQSQNSLCSNFSVASSPIPHLIPLQTILYDIQNQPFHWALLKDTVAWDHLLQRHHETDHLLTSHSTTGMRKKLRDCLPEEKHQNWSLDQQDRQGMVLMRDQGHWGCGVTLTVPRAAPVPVHT